MNLTDDLDEGTIAEWSDRGGFILFEEDEREEFVGEVPIDRVLGIIDPIANPPWHDGIDVSERGVAAALAAGRYEKRPYSSNLVTVCGKGWTSQRHEERIAWLVANPPLDPIEVEISCYGDAGVDDGMHRLYAAVIRGDVTVRVRIGGFIDHGPQALGVICASAGG